MENEKKTKTTKRLRTGRIGKPSEGTPLTSSGGFSQFLYLGNVNSAESAREQTPQNESAKKNSAAGGTEILPEKPVKKKRERKQTVKPVQEEKPDRKSVV